ncbi:D-inositol 3-phosphate glycosyltransferase [bacterium HR37]|nr:D-inositol 3-phosphate glycosyltransferase [bacterium HR37]
MSFTEKLKIALFTYSTKPRGGVVYILNLAEELVRLGQKVHIYALSTGSGFFRQVGVPHTLIPCPAIEYESIDDKISRYIQVYTDYMISESGKIKYDIYHAGDCISANVLYELRSKGLIKSFIRTVHHIDDFKSRSLIECQLRSIREPNYLIVVSRFWQNELRLHYSLDSTLIYNGIDEKRFVPLCSREDAKKELSLDGKKILLSIGGIEPRKNTLMILRAFKIASSFFKEKGECLIWIIAGGETLFDYRDYRERFFREVKELGLSIGDDIVITGNVPDNLIVKLYMASDVFVFPSVKEGWGLVVLEAMACGVPVIASNIEPFTEYLVDGFNAMLVDPYDYKALATQIVRVLEVDELREKLIKGGLETVKNYSWRKAGLEHLEFYRSVLEV